MKERSERRSRKDELKENDSFMRNSLKPRVILFGLVIAYFILSLITITSFTRENPFVEAPRWYFGVAITQPLILLLGAACLPIDRYWSHVVAVLLVGIIIYANVYRAFVGISYAHGIPILGISAARIWFQVMSSTQLLNTGLAAAITATSIIQLSRRLARRSHDATTTAGESPTIS
jgi:hypothetical protein